MKISRQWMISVALGCLFLLYTGYIVLPGYAQIRKLEYQNSELQKELKHQKKTLVNRQATGLTGPAFYTWLQQSGFSQLQLQSFSDTAAGVDLQMMGTPMALVHFLDALADSQFSRLILANLQSPAATLELDLTRIQVNLMPDRQPVYPQTSKRADVLPSPDASAQSVVIGKVKQNGACFVVSAAGAKTIMRKTPKC